MVTEEIEYFSAHLDRMIENWLDVYPSERLLVLRQEEALENPRTVFDRVVRHLGASADYSAKSLTVLTKRVNPGPVQPMSEDIKEFLEDMLAGERERFRVMVNEHQGLLGQKRG